MAFHLQPSCSHKQQVSHGKLNGAKPTMNDFIYTYRNVIRTRFIYYVITVLFWSVRFENIAGFSHVYEIHIGEHLSKDQLSFLIAFVHFVCFTSHVRARKYTFQCAVTGVGTQHVCILQDAFAKLGRRLKVDDLLRRLFCLCTKRIAFGVYVCTWRHSSHVENNREIPMCTRVLAFAFRIN